MPDDDVPLWVFPPPCADVKTLGTDSVGRPANNTRNSRQRSTASIPGSIRIVADFMNLVGFVTPGASARGFFEPQFIHSCASCRASSHDSPRRPGPPSSVSNSGITTTTVPLAAHWPWPSRRGGMHARNQLLCECYGVNTGHWLAARPPLQKGTVTTNKIRRSIERGRGGTISIFAESSHLPALLRGKLAQTPSRVTRPRLLRPNERTNERTGRGYPSVSSDVLHAIAGPTGTPATCERHKSPKGSGPVSAFARARAGKEEAWAPLARSGNQVV